MAGRHPRPRPRSLEECERIILQLNPTPDYLDVGKALCDVKDYRMFRDRGYATFAVY